MEYWIVVRTSNFDTDWYDEMPVEPLPPMDEQDAKRVADTINAATDANTEHFYRAFPSSYTPRKGMVP